MGSWLLNAISSGGYVVLAALAALENIFPPIPSELILPLAGFLVKDGRMTLLGAIVAGTIGSTLGSLPFYFIGRRLGEERLKRFAGRHGRWVALTPVDLERSAEWFDRHGRNAVFLARLVPGVRGLISLPAGIHEMPLAPFLFYTTLGTAGWTSLLVGLGYMLGSAFRDIERWLNPISYVVLGGLLLAWGWRVLRPPPDRRREPREA